MTMFCSGSEIFQLLEHSDPGQKLLKLCVLFFYGFYFLLIIFV